MAIISIFSGTYCHAEEITNGVVEKLGYRKADNELFELAVQKHGLSVEKLQRAITGTPAFFGKITHERERALAYLRSASAEMCKQDGLVFHGFNSHLIDPDISHVMKVCVIANSDYRVKIAMKTAKFSRREALSKIHDDDSIRGNWTHYIRQHDPYDESRYDILLAMQSTSVEEAIVEICQAAKSEAVKFSPGSLNQVEDFRLASEALVLLAEKGFDVDVKAESGIVHVDINKYTSRLEQQQNKISDLVKTLSGVKEVTSGPGIRFTPPPLVRVPDLNLPFKILLVDDEKEFVHTLSERLQTRNLESAIVYDGEEALEFIKNDEPEVMVLDLKMPGIDGIEVLRRVKRDHPKVEVIILTGHGSDKEEGLASDLGAFAYLHKPVNIDLLAKTMRDAYQKIGKDPSKLSDWND